MIKRFNIMSCAQKLENNWRQKAIKIEHLEISAEEEREKLYSIAIEST